MGVTAAIIGGIISAGATAGVAAMNQPKTPKARDYAAEINDTLQNQVNLAGQLYGNEAQYQPLYSALNSDVLQRTLLGGAARNRTINYTDRREYSPGEYMEEFMRKYKDGMASKDPAVMQLYNVLSNKPTPEMFRNVFGTLYKETPQTRVVRDAAQRGLLDILGDVQPRLSALTSAQRDADLNDIATLGPKAMEAMRQADPEKARLLDMLTAQAEEGLAAGTHLSPSEMREAQQHVRGAQSARGLGFGPGDAFLEAMTLGSAGRALQEERRNFAMRAIGLRQAVTGDPFMQILGRNSGASVPSFDSLVAGGSNMKGGPRLFNPESGYAQDVYSTNYNANAAAGIAQYNGINNLAGAGIGSAGNILGSYLTYKGLQN